MTKCFHGVRAVQPAREAWERGQATVELAVLVPLLVALLMMAVEGGTFLAEHVSVVNAAREGARFALDGGTDADLAAITTGNGRRLVTDASRYDVWVIRGHTTAGGAAVFDSTYHSIAGASTQPSLSTAFVQARFADCDSGASPCGTAAGLKFIAVEVAYTHNSITGSLVLPLGSITLRSYSLIKRM